MEAQASYRCYYGSEKHPTDRPLETTLQKPIAMLQQNKSGQVSLSAFSIIRFAQDVGLLT
jgi:hypothetical protein